MAARKRPPINPEAMRQKIRTGRLIRKLHQHIEGKVQLTLAQVRAIDILLRKVVPDLVQTSVTAELTHRYVAEVPPLLTRDEWQKKYKVIEHEPTMTPEEPPPPALLPPPPLKQ